MKYKGKAALTPGKLHAFIGVEKERTKAYGALSLFLLGKPSIDEVSKFLEKAEKVLEENTPAVQQLLEHQASKSIAHLSFGVSGTYTGENTRHWEEVILHFLREQFWCSLSFKFTYNLIIQKTRLCRHSKFIPVVDIPLPRVSSLGNNAFMRLADSSTFLKETNPGTWCFSVADMVINVPWKTNNTFTSWDEQSKVLKVR